MIGIDLSDWLHHTKSLQRIGEDGCDIISFFLGSHFRVRSALSEVLRDRDPQIYKPSNENAVNVAMDLLYDLQDSSVAHEFETIVYVPEWKAYKRMDPITGIVPPRLLDDSALLFLYFLRLFSRVVEAINRNAQTATNSS